MPGNISTTLGRIVFLPSLASLNSPDSEANSARVCVWQKERNGAFVQFQGVNGRSFSKEGVKNISSMFKLSGSQSVTLEQKQSEGKREKSKSTPGQGGLMHTNGFCHLRLGKIYDSAPRRCKQSTKQQTLAPYCILRQRNLKGGAGRVGGHSLSQKSARRHFLFKPSGLDVAFEERRRGSIINPHFLLQTADATLTPSRLSQLQAGMASSL